MNRGFHKLLGAKRISIKNITYRRGRNRSVPKLFRNEEEQTTGVPKLSRVTRNKERFSKLFRSKEERTVRYNFMSDGEPKDLVQRIYVEGIKLFLDFSGSNWNKSPCKL